jgi:hypothetical protein
MTEMENKPTQGTVRIVWTSDERYMKEGEYSLIVPIPDEIATLIGRIAIVWGAFELRMNAVIEQSIISLRKTDIPPAWKHWSFDKRQRLFKDLLTAVTKIHFPNETKTFQLIADQAGDLQWRRNTVVHGLSKADQYLIQMSRLDLVLFFMQQINIEEKIEQLT